MRTDWTAILVAVCVVVLFIGLLIMAYKSDEEKKNAFMQECLRDHKAYECEAMWSGSRPDNVIINNHTPYYRR